MVEITYVLYLTRIMFFQMLTQQKLHSMLQALVCLLQLLHPQHHQCNDTL